MNRNKYKIKKASVNVGLCHKFSKHLKYFKKFLQDEEKLLLISTAAGWCSIPLQPFSLLGDLIIYFIIFFFQLVIPVVLVCKT